MRRIRSQRAMLPVVLLVLYASAASAPALAVTLISRSAGLEEPSKEEGNTEFEFADVNGDGELDLVSVGDHGSPYVNSDQHGIMVWLGDGAGSWDVHQFGNFGYGGCAVGDLDHDGLMDVAWGIHHNWGGGMDGRLMGAARGDGSGTFWTDWGEGLASNGEEWGMFATALADFDGDGWLDIVSQSFGGSNGVRVYHNQHDGTWAQAYALTGGSVGYTLEAGDVNADGHADIVSTRAGSYVLLGDGNFGFTTATSGLPASSIHGIAIGDIDRDGDLDLACGYGSNGVRCYSYEDGYWSDTSTGLPTSGYHDLTQLGDIDGDGWLDLITYDPPQGKVFLGDGSGHWTADATWSMPTPGDASALRVDGDCDHDGREDIAISASMSGFPFYRNQLRVYSPSAPPTELTARLVMPQGGETLRLGSVRLIRWLAAVPAGEGPATVDLELSTTGPGGPWESIASGLPNSGRYQWTVVANQATTQGRVRLTVTSTAGSATAISPADFTLVAGGASVSDGGASDAGAGAGGGQLAVTVFPTIGATSIDLRFATPSVHATHLVLLDAAGRLIGERRLSAAVQAARVDLESWRGAPIPPGRFFLRVQRGGEQRVVPIVRVAN